MQMLPGRHTTRAPGPDPIRAAPGLIRAKRVATVGSRTSDPGEAEDVKPLQAHSCSVSGGSAHLAQDQWERRQMDVSDDNRLD